MTNEIKENVIKLMAESNIEIKSTFVPFSRSMNKGEKYPSLNYKITLLQNGKEILTTAYSMGCAHAPAYNDTIKGEGPVYHKQRITEECELGHALTRVYESTRPKIKDGKKQFILPCQVDMLYSLLLDSSVIDYPDFENWANNFGYDSESRKAENIYKHCLGITLKLRTAIDDDLRAKFNELLQDY